MTKQNRESPTAGVLPADAIAPAMMAAYDHCLLFVAPVNQVTCLNFTNYIVELSRGGAKSLLLAMNSPGGDVDAGFTICNLIQSARFDIDVHNIGNVDSVANIIFLGGKRRFSVSTGVFLFHGVGFDGNGAERLEERNLKIKLGIVEAQHKRMASVLESRTSIAASEATKLFERDERHDANWAKDKGIIHEIVDFKIPAKADLKYLMT